jgi:hypothetical protein
MAEKLMPPSAAHIRHDEFGRDIWARTVHGRAPRS